MGWGFDCLLGVRAPLLTSRAALFLSLVVGVTRAVLHLTGEWSVGYALLWFTLSLAYLSLAPSLDDAGAARRYFYKARDSLLSQHPFFEARAEPSSRCRCRLNSFPFLSLTPEWCAFGT